MLEIEERLKLLGGELFSYSSMFSTNLDSLKGEVSETINDVSLVKKALTGYSSKDNVLEPKDIQWFKECKRA